MSKQLQYEKEFDALHCVSRLYAAEIQADVCFVGTSWTAFGIFATGKIQLSSFRCSTPQMSQLWLNNKAYILPTRAKSNRSQNAMEWGRSKPYQTLLQCKFGRIPVWKREALAVVSRVNSFQASKPCLVGWLVYHVFEDNSCMICSGSCSCLDMHLIISFSCTIFWIRRFEVHLSERSRASPAPHRNFRIHSKEPARSTSAPRHHASLPMLPSPKVRWPVAASLEQLAPPHQCHEFKKPKLWMELWWIDELCVFHTTFCAAWCFNLVLRSLINV